MDPHVRQIDYKKHCCIGKTNSVIKFKKHQLYMDGMVKQ
jgi:hypothetical protein